MLLLSLLALSASLAAAAAAAGPHWSLAEDPYAFPKYRVSFLNGLPVLNHTAEQWLAVGLKGGELEFLGQPWNEQPPQSSASTRREIESGFTHDQPSESDLFAEASNSHSPSQSPRYRLERMQHRQGWFTYAYCHNNQVRQFREMAHAHPHHAGYVPEEDPEWEAFTLGQAATLPSEGRELTNAQQEILASNVDIVRTAGHRYLVQRWGDGTMCDKTARPREIEVQFHCSQTLTDTILFVKETSTCHYIMVIHTPRLCGEPGFRTRLEQREEAPIRCREVLDSPEAIAAVDKTLPAASHPLGRHVRPSILDAAAPPPAPHAPALNEPAGLGKRASDVLRAAIETFLSGNAGSDAQEGGETIVLAGDDGDVLIDFEFVDADGAEDAFDKLEGLLGKASGKLEMLEEALRAAGYDVQGMSDEGDDGKQQQQQQKKESGSEAEEPKKTAKHEEL